MDDFKIMSKKCNYGMSILYSTPCILKMHHKHTPLGLVDF